jgi:uncharacterized protein (UPF0210 family)
MKIRSITYFFNPGWPLQEAELDKARDFNAAARLVFEKAGYEVQTTRLVSASFSGLIERWNTSEPVEFAQVLEQAARQAGYGYTAAGPAFPARPESYAAIPAMLAATRDFFMSGVIADKLAGLSLPAVKACAGIIHQASTITPDGFTNLRFAAAANVPAGGPFLPTGYHDGGAPSFAIATQAADLAVQAVTDAKSLSEVRLGLVRLVEENAAVILQAARTLAERFGLAFGGIDFSLAPFPQQALSFGEAMERLGLPSVGLHGSLAAAAILIDALDQARYPRAGFNGLMLPVLEDYVLAKRAGEGKLSLKDMLLYSAVCGTGLDTIPLPGDASQEQLAAVLLDVAALSLRLDKPLTARLMPLPGKAVGDPTHFEFGFFADSGVMSLEAAPLSRFMVGDETFLLAPRARLEGK